MSPGKNMCQAEFKRFNGSPTNPDAETQASSPAYLCNGGVVLQNESLPSAARLHVGPMRRGRLRREGRPGDLVEGDADAFFLRQTICTVVSSVRSAQTV